MYYFSMEVVQNEYGFFNLRIDETLNDQLVKIAAEEGKARTSRLSISSRIM